MKDFINNNSFERPGYIPESAWHKHAPFANWLLTRQKPQKIVELGVHNGFSFFIFCHYANKNAGKCMCYGVDHWQGDDHAGFFDDSIYEHFIAKQNDYKEVSEVIRKSFDEAVELFEDSSIDLLHIDGRHYYEDVKSDFNNWKPKLKNNAIVLFHDTRVFDNDFGVYQFWNELVQEYSMHFEFIHGHGLGVLCIGDGSSVHPIVKKLFELPEKIRNEVRDAYKKIGDAIHYEYLLKAYNIQYNPD